MKRILLSVLSAILTLNLLACGLSEPTIHYEKSLYKAGEIIRVYDDDSAARLADLVITNVRVISSTPYTSQEYLCTTENFTDLMKKQYEGKTEIHGEKVYVNVEYKGIVQIDYIGNAVDSHNDIDRTNFKITDINGEAVDTAVDVNYKRIETEDDYLVIGVKELDELLITFAFHPSQNRTCDIVCEYDKDTGSYIIVEDNSDDSYCDSCNKLLDYEDKYCRYCGAKQ